MTMVEIITAAIELKRVTESDSSGPKWRLAHYVDEVVAEVKKIRN